MSSSTPSPTQRSAIASGASNAAGRVAQQAPHIGPATEVFAKALVTEPRGRDELHISADALREHLVQLDPRGKIAGLEGSARCETWLRIGILTEDHAAHAVGSDPIEGRKSMRTLRLPGKGLAATRGKNRLPGFEIETGIDPIEIIADGSERILPDIRQIGLPAGQRFRHRLPQSSRHHTAPPTC
ncbi:hypothetical protein [Ensifer canadensis]